MNLCNPLILLKRCISFIPTSLWNQLVPLLVQVVKRIMPSRHAIIRHNINRVCSQASEPDRKLLYDESWHNIFSIIYHTSKFSNHKSYYARNTDLQNLGSLYESHAKHKGVILVTAHTGNFLIAGAVLSMHFPISIVTRIGSNRFIYHGMHQYYRSLNLEPIDRVGGVFPIIRALKKNKIVVFALDQHAGSNGVWVDFFGKPASTFTSPTQLARRLGCPVHTAFAGKWTNHSLQVKISKPIPMQKSENLQDDLLKNTITLSQEIEHFIKNNPETWMALHNRWKPQYPALAGATQSLAALNETNTTSSF